MKKTLFPLLCMILSSAMLYAQTANSFQYKFPEKKNGPFNKLDVALTLGSTGVGIDVTRNRFHAGKSRFYLYAQV